MSKKVLYLVTVILAGALVYLLCNEERPYELLLVLVLSFVFVVKIIIRKELEETTSPGTHSAEKYQPVYPPGSQAGEVWPDGSQNPG